MTFARSSYNNQHFFIRFGVGEHPPELQFLAIFYWTFTTLTTVGFGDLYPVSDSERIMGTLVFLFQGAVFSMILGNFGQILQCFNTLNEDINESDDLQRFFGLLEYFNDRQPL